MIYNIICGLNLHDVLLLPSIIAVLFEIIPRCNSKHSSTKLLCENCAPLSVAVDVSVYSLVV